MTRAAILALYTKIAPTVATMPTAHVFVSVHQYAPKCSRNVAKGHIDAPHVGHLSRGKTFGAADLRPDFELRRLERTTAGRRRRVGGWLVGGVEHGATYACSSACARQSLAQLEIALSNYVS